MDIFPKYISSSLHFLNWETQRGSHNPYYHLLSWGANTGWRWPLALCMAWQGHSAVRILVWFSRLLLHQGVGGTGSWDRIHDSDCGLATISNEFGGKLWDLSFLTCLLRSLGHASIMSWYTCTMSPYSVSEPFRDAPARLFSSKFQLTDGRINLPLLSIEAVWI